MADRRFVTGSYDNKFVLYNSLDRSSVVVEAEHDAPKRKKKKKKSSKKDKDKDEPVDISNIDFTKRVLHVAWHPQQNAVAVAGLNKLYIYQATRSKAGK